MSVKETIKKAGSKVKNGGKKVVNFCKKDPETALVMGIILFYAGVIALAVWKDKKDEKEAAEAYEKAQKELNELWETKYKGNYNAFKAFAETFKLEPGQALYLGYYVEEDKPPEHIVAQEVTIEGLGKITMKEYI